MPLTNQSPIEEAMSRIIGAPGSSAGTSAGDSFQLAPKSLLSYADFEHPPRRRPLAPPTTTTAAPATTKTTSTSYQASGPALAAATGRLIGTPGAIAQYLGQPDAATLLAGEKAATLGANEGV